WEYNMILAVAAVGVAMLGPGTYSLDHAFGLDDTLSGWLGLAVSAGLGILGGVGLLVAVYRPPAPEAADAS
ncbi:MAG: DoxX family protein, partial [Microthrixaceae bacterium]|nr:DoxX family protein [Microthrixaceae bacterium]